MEFKFKPGDRVIAVPTASRLIGTIERALGLDEADEEVGPMYRMVIDVFEEELTPC